MKINLAHRWSQISWLYLIPLSLLVIGVGWQGFLDPRYRQPDDMQWATFFAILLAVAFFLAPFFRGWLVALFGGLTGAALLIIPSLNPNTAGSIWISAWILLASYLIGDFLLRWKNQVLALPSIDHLTLSILLGLTCLMIVAALLGFTRLYYPVAAWITLGLPTVGLLAKKIHRILLRRPWRNLSWPAQLPDIRMPAWGITVVIICGFGAYLWALAPVVRYDSLSYHIPTPLNNIDHHAITEMPENIQSYSAHYAESLYTLGLLIDPNPSLPAMLHFQIGILATLLTFMLGRKLGGVSQGIIAAVIFWSLPIIQVEAGSAYIDLFPTAFICAAIYTLWLWVEKPDPVWLVVTGVFTGTALGAKLTALFPAVLIGLFVIYTNARLKKSAWNMAKQALLFAIPVILIASPWLVRDWLWTGNPIFPSYNSIFDSPKAFSISVSYEIQPSARNFSRLLAIPIKMLFKTRGLYHEMPGFAFGGISLFALPLIYPWASSAHKRHQLLALLGFAVANLLINQQIIRYLRYTLYIFPILALLASENIVLAWSAFQNRWLKRILLAAGLLLGASYLLFTQLAVTIRQYYIPERYPYRYVLHMESADQFLSRAFPLYTTFQFLDTQPPPEKKVLSLGNEFRLYTSARIYGPLFSKEAYELLHQAPDRETLARSLSQLGYTHILFYRPEIDLRPIVYSAPVLDNQFLYRHTHIIYTAPNVRLYQFNADPKATLPENLLKNSGFESLTDQGTPATWEIVGDLFVSSDGSQSRTGQVAILITGPSITGAFQNTPVIAGDFYTISYWAKPEEGEQLLQLFVMWLDDNLQMFDKTAEFAWLKPGWNNYQTTFIPPPGAAFARIVVTTATPGTAWIDDMCFIAGGVCP